jgi:succinoglycan biosynthesis protein ExoA
MSIITSRAKLRARPTPIAAAAEPFLSVVVPIRNEERFIGQTLADLVSQDWDPARVEILVVDGESVDATRDVVMRFVERFQHVRLLRNPKCWSSAARNIGVAASRGDYVLIIDAHCEIPDTNYFRCLCDAFARSGADAIGRPQPLDVTGASARQRAIAAARSSPLGHHPSSYIYSYAESYVPAHSVAVAYRRAVFDKIGWFDESFDACEDVEFNQRFDDEKLTCFFTPQVLVRYHPRPSLRALFKQMTRYGQGRARLACKHPETISLGSFLPALFVLGLIVGLPLSWLHPYLALVYASVCALYVAIVLATSLQIVARRPSQWRLGAWLPLVFPAIHIGAGFGLLRELMMWALRRGKPAVATALPTKPR